MWRGLGSFLIARLATVEDRPFVLRDLEEEYQAILVASGAREAGRWFRRQVLTSIWPLLRRRMARGRGPDDNGPRTRRSLRNSLMEESIRDVRYALRTLRQRPAYTGIAILTLALGIGANTAIFSVVNGVLFKGVPALRDTDGLVEISRDVNGSFFDMAYPVIDHVRRSAQSLDDLVAMTPRPVAVGGDEPEVHMGMVVTGNYFSALRLVPAAGRFFAPDESFYPNVADVVVVSHALWERKYQSDPDLIGRTIRVNGVPLEVIGVAPKTFHGQAAGLQFELWMPIGVDVPGLPEASGLDHPLSGQLEAFGRLAPGATVETAAAEIETLAGGFLQSHQADFDPAKYTARVETWAPVPAIIRGPVLGFFTVLMVLVGLVLTMASTNVANMILARSTERRNEIAVRLAIGAGRARVVRQLVTESLVLFVGAGLVGTLLAVWGTGILLTFQPPLPPGFLVELDLSLDARVLTFAIGLSMLTGILFGLFPAYRATRPDLVPALKDDPGAAAPDRTRWRGVLVGVQMAATLVLLVAAGLFIRALASMERLDPGWQPDGVTTVALDLELVGYSREQGQRFYRDLLERVRSFPGVESAALAAKLPLAGRSSFGWVNVAGLEPPAGRGGYDAYLNRVSSEYFNTLDLQLLAGRGILATDGPGQETVAVVNRAMAERMWPGADPLGQRFHTGSVEEGTSFLVVGVVENAKYRRLVEETPNFYYVSYQQFYNPQLVLQIESERDARALAPVVRETLASLDPYLPAPAVQSLSERLDFFFLPQRLAAWIAGVMGAMGLLLGAVGVYGVTAFSIGQRTREIGVRIALGASSRDVVRMTVAQGLVAPVTGMFVGLLLAAGASRLLSAFLAGIHPLDPVSFGLVSTGLVLVAAGAAYLPARRAARLDPAATLRGE